MGLGMGRTDRDHARFAERDPCRKKECRAPPYDPLGGGSIGRNDVTAWRYGVYKLPASCLFASPVIAPGPRPLQLGSPHTRQEAPGSYFHEHHLPQDMSPEPSHCSSPGLQ